MPIYPNNNLFFFLTEVRSVLAFAERESFLGKETIKELKKKRKQQEQNDSFSTFFFFFNSFLSLPVRNQ